MNWKNITVENGFIKQQIDLKGSKAVSYIPINKIDSFGVTSTENKAWLYLGFFFGFCGILATIAKNTEAATLPTLFSIAFTAIYFLTRQIMFTITSNQKKFSVKVITTDEEMVAVNMLIVRIKESIKEESQIEDHSKAA